MTDAQARDLVLRAGFSPLNVDLLCQLAYGGDWQAWVADLPQTTLDNMEDDLSNSRVGA